MFVHGLLIAPADALCEGALSQRFLTQIDVVGSVVDDMPSRDKLGPAVRERLSLRLSCNESKVANCLNPDRARGATTTMRGVRDQPRGKGEKWVFEKRVVYQRSQ